MGILENVVVPPPIGAGLDTIESAGGVSQSSGSSSSSKPSQSPSKEEQKAPVQQSVLGRKDRAESSPSVSQPAPSPTNSNRPLPTTPSPQAGPSSGKQPESFSLVKKSVLDGLDSKSSNSNQVRLTGIVRNIRADPFLPLSFPVFGIPLDLLIDFQGVGYVPLLVARCVQYLWARLDTVGLFRVESLQSTVQKYMDRYNAGENPDLEKEVKDPILVAHLLKKFFQMLPEPIMTYTLYGPLLATTQIADEKERIAALREECDKLPAYNHALLEMYFGFLKHFATFSDKNKMGIENLATIFSPSFLKKKNETPEDLLANNSKVLQVLTDIVSHSDDIFGVFIVKKLEERFELLEEIGSGTFGVVRKCRDKKTREIFAVKSVSLSGAEEKSIRQLQNEVTILKKIRHPNTIQLYALCETPQVIHIVTEYVPDGALLHEIFKRGTFNSKNTQNIIYQLLCTLDYLHAMGVVHRDIKPDNILLTSTRSLQIKLADFGISKIFEDTVKLSTGGGTPPFMAPEMFSDQPYHGKPVDIWSVGVLTYKLLCGVLPFDGKNYMVLIQAILNSNPSFDGPAWKKIKLSARGKAFILRLLNKDPEKRPTARECLEDYWMKKVVERQRKEAQERLRDFRRQKPHQQPPKEEPNKRFHSFESKTYRAFCFCAVCKGVMWGLFQTGQHCRICKIDVHDDCATDIGKTCPMS